jgi:hypothetical protein
MNGLDFLGHATDTTDHESTNTFRILILRHNNFEQKKRAKRAEFHFLFLSVVPSESNPPCRTGWGAGNGFD